MENGNSGQNVLSYGHFRKLGDTDLNEQQDPERKSAANQMEKADTESKSNQNWSGDPDDDDTVGECGFWRFKPRCLQPCANLGAFTAAYSLTALGSSTLIIYVNSQVTTLERQFGFSSSQTGLILAANDIGFLSFIIIFSYFALKVHIPRTISIFTVLFGLSGLLCCLPHFLYGAGDVSSDVTNVTMTSVIKKRGSFDQLCLLDGDRTDAKCHTAVESADESSGAAGGRRHSQAALVMIVIGMMLQGICKCPRSPYAVAYIDGSVKDKTRTGFYLGITMAVAIFGPVFSFVLGGVFAKLHVTLGPTTLTPRHPRWIGAWWLGFFAFGLFSIIAALPLFLFPRWLRGKPPEAETKPKQCIFPSKKKKFGEVLHQIKEFARAVLRLVTNSVFVSLIVSACLMIFSVGGTGAFFPKYMENQFSLPAWRANLIMAVMYMTTSSFGTFAGGYLTRKFKMSALTNLKVSIVLYTIAMLATASGYLLKCEQPTIQYMPGAEGSNTANITCNDKCSCDNDDYLPVCGSDGRTYFSPCHAGCTDSEGRNSYTNCTCISGGSATPGVCDYGCSRLYTFAALQALAALAHSLAIMPNTMAFIRCVSPVDKAFAMGCQGFLTSLLGWLLGPVLFGHTIDGVCALWEITCSGRGRCLLYDNDVFRVRLFSLVTGARAAGVVFLLLAYVAARLTKRLNESEAREGTRGEKTGPE